MPRRTPITGELAKQIPRFEFIAHYLAVATAKKRDRELSHGYYVRRRGGKWQVVTNVTGSPLVIYETRDPALLFDYARRGPLGYYTRQADQFRVEAYTPLPATTA